MWRVVGRQWRFNAQRTGRRYYKATLRLPQTDFALRVKPYETDMRFQSRCTEQLYDWQQKTLKDNTEFILHDGPPYANGQVHMGHFLNKVLKDVINRYKLLTGHRIRYIPGWDCHGLPIELKVVHSNPQEIATMTSVALRAAAAEFARATLQTQMGEFKRWGVMGEWDNAYTTMAPDYEAEQMSVFMHMAESGLIYRALKPVHWSPSSQTALAEAELEYQDDHESQAVFVALPITTDSLQNNNFGRALKDTTTQAALVVWTTTPWTLPANRAVCYNEEIVYVVCKNDSGRILVVAEDTLESLKESLGDLVILSRVEPGGLEGLRAEHPIFKAREIPVLAGSHVTTETGTGLVHTAPAHGLEDFYVCEKNGLSGVEFVGNAVDDTGVFTDEAGPEFVGKHVLEEGNEAVLTHIKTTGHLLHRSTYKHRYPYDWRTKKPVIQRATYQWFCQLSELQQTALDAMENVDILPNAGRARLSAFVRGRKEWCISRQRSWGVPLPVFYDQKGDPILDRECVEHVRELVSVHGADCWWKMETDELLPLKYRGKNLVRGRDTLDVWFDSGVSWKAALHPRGIKKRADLYVEGSDQHRGWFQSSLLTSVSVTKEAPYKKILSHGFVLDQHMHKMSKSLGNVIQPADLIAGATVDQIKDTEHNDDNKHNDNVQQNKDEVAKQAEPAAPLSKEELKKQREERKRKRKEERAQKKKNKNKNKNTATKQQPKYGADVLRLWVGLTDFTSDITIGADIIEKAAQIYYKFRTVCRFLLGNLAHFSLEDKVPFDQLMPLDKYMLRQLADYNTALSVGYDNYNFSKVTSLMTEFMTTTLSALYLDVVKDRLYLDSPRGLSRRSCQTVLVYILENLVKSMSPMLPHLAEEIHENIDPTLARAMNRSGREMVDDEFESFFTKGWLVTKPEWETYDCDTIDTSMKFRKEVLKLVEVLRKDDMEVKSPLETEVFISIPEQTEMARQLKGTLEPTHLEQLFISSRVQLFGASGALEEELEKRENSITRTVEILHKGEAVEVVIGVARSQLGKCQRCWRHNVPQIEGEEGASLCGRCADVLQEIGHVA